MTFFQERGSKDGTLNQQPRALATPEKYSLFLACGQGSNSARTEQDTYPRRLQCYRGAKG